MVDLEQRLAQVKELVDAGKYFTINRARQFGKTTTLQALYDYLNDDYFVVSMDFQMQMSDAKFKIPECVRSWRRCIPFNLSTELVSIGFMFGFLKNEEGQDSRTQFIRGEGTTF